MHTYLESPLHEQTNATQNQRRILIPPQHQIAHAGMIRQAQPRGEDTVDQLLRTFHILSHGDRLGIRIINDIQRRNASAVIPQQTFETGERDRREVREETVCRARILIFGTHRHETVEVEQHRLDGPGVAMLAQHVERIGDMSRGGLIRIVRHLRRGDVCRCTKLTESLKLIQEFV